ncbi:PA0069 family radical SAM protein [Ralstonia sp. NFACC01]|jgi:DNA repair photolyase|uniref:PA0069 family radical SAM protein n=1 Tax=Ralstonia sp. NFACC01 TaxID=1566294 RepID=UPI0008EC92C7|nr:PA0069 family radical SAM protein [Ralstonia sp. NFACC01]SFP39190.1 DNA repair photolyase [Ralstonia sp. NFACC01]
MSHRHVPRKGRGATSNLQGRFERDERARVDDGWQPLVGHLVPDDAPPRIETSVSIERARSILSHNQSPDIPFGVSLNPYRGCEHGCVYCFARPTHAYLELSPGLDFETKLFAKTNAAEVLRETLAKPSYRCEAIALGVNTDAYQPIERELRITRDVLQVLHDCDHPVGLITKSTLIERDVDLLAPMAAKNLVVAAVTITTLDADLARKLEPRAATPSRRLRTIRTLAEAGIPVGVSVAPMIPFITDDHMEQILEAAREAGATYASYIVLRLPNELNTVFQDWLMAHFPDRAQRVMNRIRDLHGGQDYKADFATRMRGTGIWADLLRQRFYKSADRLGFSYHRYNELVLDTSQFKPPARAVKPRKPVDERQGSLF